MSEGLSQDNEMIDVDKLDLKAFGVKESQLEEVKKKLLVNIEEISKEAPEKVAPPGTLGLPPLLEKRRLDWEIPDGVFKTCPGALYDRILLWQIPVLAKNKADSLTFGGGLIAKSDQSKAKEQKGAPRAVIVGAGLQALDWMRCHGVDIGHIVYFSLNTVYTIEVDYIAGKFQRISLARGGDLILSEDLAAAILGGKAKVFKLEEEASNGTTFVSHCYQDADGRTYDPVYPGTDDDL